MTAPTMTNDVGRSFRSWRPQLRSDLIWDPTHGYLLGQLMAICLNTINIAAAGAVDREFVDLFGRKHAHGGPGGF